jgi:hypothetical protein
MNWKRRLFLLWLAASSVWIVFTCFEVIELPLDEIAWNFREILELLVIFLGLPLACLGAAIAIMWIADGTKSG